MPEYMTMNELTEWLNIVIDVQADSQYWDYPDDIDGADEVWGFFSDWREDLKEAAWKMLFGD